MVKEHNSDPDWIRTNDPQLRRLMLYPAELPGRNGAKVMDFSENQKAKYPNATVGTAKKNARAFFIVFPCG